MAESNGPSPDPGPGPGEVVDATQPLTDIERSQRTAEVLRLLDKSFRAHRAGLGAASDRAAAAACRLDVDCVSVVQGGILIGEIPDPARDPAGWAGYVQAAQDRATGELDAALAQAAAETGESVDTVRDLYDAMQACGEEDRTGADLDAADECPDVWHDDDAGVDDACPSCGYRVGGDEEPRAGVSGA